MDADRLRAWYEDLLGTGDLVRARKALEGEDHPFADVLRGRLASLEFRHREASRCFRTAAERLARMPETPWILVLRFRNEIYRFENALVEGPVRGAPPGLLALPEWLRRELSRDPHLRRALDQRRQCEGLLRLHLGDFEGAYAVFDELVRERPLAPPEQVAAYLLGRAAAEEGLGRRRQAIESLDGAGLAACTVEWVLPAGLLAAALAAVERVIGREEEAEGWEEFLERIECPERTRRLLRERAERMRRRSFEMHRVVVF